MTLVLIWASPEPSEYAPFGPHLDLVTLVPTWASSGHGSTAWPAGWPDMDLVTLVPTWASSGHGSTHGLLWPHLDPVTLVATWASSGHGSSPWPAGWAHLDLVSGVVTLASPMPGDTGPHVALFYLVNLVLT